MLTYVLKRSAYAVVVVLGVMTLVFFMLHLLPGDATSVMLADFGASAEQQAQLRAELGLDRPVVVQYVSYMTNALRGDFGRSLFTGRPALDQVLSQLPKTLELALAAIVIAVVIGAVLGITAAIKRNTWWDGASMVVALLALSMPNFWLGLVFIFVFALQLGWFPVAGSDTWRHLVLPATALGLSAAGLIARLVRSSMLEVLRQDFVRTAYAKGIGERAVYLKHVLRNAALPVITVLGLSFGNLLGGAVLTETVFGRPGLGKLIVDAIIWQDYPVAQAAIFVFAVMFLIVNLLTDLSYALLDPRISYA